MSEFSRDGAGKCSYETSTMPVGRKKQPVMGKALWVNRFQLEEAGYSVVTSKPSIGEGCPIAYKTVNLEMWLSGGEYRSITVQFKKSKMIQFKKLTWIYINYWNYLRWKLLIQKALAFEGGEPGHNDRNESKTQSSIKSFRNNRKEETIRDVQHDFLHDWNIYRQNLNSSIIDISTVSQFELS